MEYEQNGEDKAKYGEKLIRTIEKKLKDKGLKGMSFTLSHLNLLLKLDYYRQIDKETIMDIFFLKGQQK